MKYWLLPLALVIGVAPVAAVAAEPLAPPVVQKRAATEPKAKTAPDGAAAPACGAPGAAACAKPPARTAQSYRAALASARPSGEASSLDDSLVAVMSRLLEAGRCADAAALATRSGAADLAARARQLCGTN